MKGSGSESTGPPGASESRRHAGTYQVLSLAWAECGAVAHVGLSVANGRAGAGRTADSDAADSGLSMRVVGYHA